MTNNTCTVLAAPPSEVRRQIDEWLLAYDKDITHFVTLTFDAKRIDSLIDRNPQYKGRSDPHLVEMYQRSMRHFLKRLQKTLYGNSAKRRHSRLLFIPILEGLQVGEVPHYHCLAGVSSDRADGLTKVVKSCWARIQFAGQQIKVLPRISSGCIRYSAKNATSLTRESVDWLNIQQPHTIGSSY